MTFTLHLPVLSKRLWLTVACLATLAAPAYAGFDPFGTESLTSGARNSARGAAATACSKAPGADVELTLAAAIDYALCNNPQTQRAWANAKAQAAQVGEAKASYLPTITATAQNQREKSTTTVDALPELNNDVNSRLRTVRVDLNMVLFDFGARAANLENARQLLGAANAAHDATLQAISIDAAQAFYDAQTARSQVEAIRSAKTLAEQSFRAAEARFKIGLGSGVEKLQAETAFAQERLKLLKAEGALQVALGNLATVMGFAANTPLRIDGGDDKRMPDVAFVKSVATLMEDAKQKHPNLVAARAQLYAAQASEGYAKAQYFPTISFNASNSRATQPSSQLGLPPLTTQNRGMQFGVQVNFPLFDGFGRMYRARQAHAQTEMRAADVAEMEQQVALGVWKTYQALQTATVELKVAEQYRQSAANTVEAAQARYTLGATQVLELLNAQATLANAETQKIQALSEWRTSRLRLAFNLGILGTWTLR